MDSNFYGTPLSSQMLQLIVNVHILLACIMFNMIPGTIVMVSRIRWLHREFDKIDLENGVELEEYDIGFERVNFLGSVGRVARFGLAAIIFD